MLEGAPYVPLWGTIRESVAVFSYCDRIDFGVTADRGADDAGVLVAGIAAGLRELGAAARKEAGRRSKRTAAPVAAAG